MASPRYVDRDEVDSAAMLAATAYSLHVDKHIWETIGIWGHPPLTLHRDIFTGVEEDLLPPGFYAVRCAGGPSCKRCVEGNGGYKFRWFSPLWYRAYVAGARPGSWLPGNPETRWRQLEEAFHSGAPCGTGAENGTEANACHAAPLDDTHSGTLA